MFSGASGIAIRIEKLMREVCPGLLTTRRLTVVPGRSCFRCSRKSSEEVIEGFAISFRPKTDRWHFYSERTLALLRDRLHPTATHFAGGRKACVTALKASRASQRAQWHASCGQRAASKHSGCASRRSRKAQ